MESAIRELFAERIGGKQYGLGTAIYKFEKIKRAKAAARKAYPDVELIDMGVGEPDEKAFPEVIATLKREADLPENRGYTDNGIPEFKQAAARYMKNVYGVTIDAETEVNHTIGSKSALSILPKCFINPGDVALMTTPGYPVFGTHSKYLGGVVHNLPLLAENNFLPDLKSIPSEVLAKAKTLVINYPNNPTGASATRAFFEEAIAFGKQHGILIIHDAAYTGIPFHRDDYLSILTVPGAKEIAIELHSLSKAYNMTGWRIGFITGNALVVRAFADVKDNTDSGQFAAIQKAGAYCLDHPEIQDAIAAKYSRRMDLLVPVLAKHGFHAKKPKGSFFLYVRSPKSATPVAGGPAVTFGNAEDFSQFMITQSLISTVPWDDAGPYVRWSVTFVTKGDSDAARQQDEHRVIAEIDRRLGQFKFEF